MKFSRETFACSSGINYVAIGPRWSGFFGPFRPLPPLPNQETGEPSFKFFNECRSRSDRKLSISFIQRQKTADSSTDAFHFHDDCVNDVNFSVTRHVWRSFIDRKPRQCCRNSDQRAVRNLTTYGRTNHIPAM